ncbi:MAG TPA: S1 RNA-binding domain-containing protein [Thermoanaerobaculia bacterium]|nr:S1 RNA-binding domain-containing protein [Thermoanaerobaculia bacterium]
MTEEKTEEQQETLDQQESGQILAATEATEAPEVTEAPEATEAAEETSEEQEQAQAQAQAQDFGQILAEFSGSDEQQQTKAPEIGEKVRGRILSIGETAAFVDLGGKSEGVIEIAQLKDPVGNLTVSVGDEIEATVTGNDPETGSLVLRRKAARGQDVALELRQALETGLPVEGIVTTINKGGAEVQVAGMRAFCPLSQLDLRYVENPQQFVGQRMAFRVSRIEPGKTRPNIVLSRRALLEEEAETKAADTRSRLQVGTVLTGKVTSLTSYGAFVDLGGLEGMLHVSEIGYSRLAHPGEALQVGQEVEVQIIKVEKGKDEKRPRISLSRRALERDPWSEAADQFPEGTELTGRVMRLESFGAFVEIAPGIEGLVHISEMGANRRLNHARDAVQAGQEVQVRVLGVDPGKRRISLSMGSNRGGGGDLATSASSSRGGGGGGYDRGPRAPRERERYDEAEVAAYANRGGSSGGGNFGSMADFFKNIKRK